jgi:hypothetical protein
MSPDIDVRQHDDDHDERLKKIGLLLIQCRRQLTLDPVLFTTHVGCRLSVRHTGVRRE